MKLEQLNNIIETVNNIAGLKIQRKCRKRNYLYARWVYFKLANENVKLATLSEIGGSIGLNHATVIHGLRRVELDFKNSEYIQNVYKESLKILKPEVKEEIEKLDKENNYYKKKYIEEYNAHVKYINKNKGLLECLSEVLDDINKLSISDLDELIEMRIRPFLVMKKTIKPTPIKRVSKYF